MLVVAVEVTGAVTKQAQILTGLHGQPTRELAAQVVVVMEASLMVRILEVLVVQILEAVQEVAVTTMVVQELS